MRESTFARADLEETTAAFNRVFEEYVVPMAFSQAQFAIHLDANQVDRSLSPIWYDERDDVVAAAALAVRERRGWIGGFGIAPPYRGRGYGARLIGELIETARRRELSTLSLEVLQQNHAALRTYERAGFTTVRELLSFTWHDAPPSIAAGLPAYTSHEPFLQVCDDVAPCWQREDASLRRQPALHAVGDAHRFAVFRHNGTDAQVLKLRAASPQDVTSLAQAIRVSTGVTGVGIFNEPAESLVVSYLRELSWKATFMQYEMRRAIA